MNIVLVASVMGQFPLCPVKAFRAYQDIMTCFSGSTVAPKRMT